MTSQHVLVASSPAKPVAPHPVFPLSSVELQRWNRFARKGGIGRARAKVDKVSQDAARDLMFLEGDEIVVLMDLGDSTYLGFCEGVTGLFSGMDVIMQQAKLKRPVVSSRSSQSASDGTSSKPSVPLQQQAWPANVKAENGPQVRRKAAAASEVEVLDERFGSLDGEVARRRYPYRESRGEARETLVTAQSPALAGAFPSPSFPSLNESSPYGPSEALPSPAPSTASTGSTRTPSLVTSSFSDFHDHGRDDESISSISGHGLTPLQGPSTPLDHSAAWQPSSSHIGGAPSSSFRKGDLPVLLNGPTPTNESFPIASGPLSTLERLSRNDRMDTQCPLPDERQYLPQSSDQTQRTGHAGAYRPIAASSGMTAPAPSLRELPSPPSPEPVSGRQYTRQPKSSDSSASSSSTSGLHVPGALVDDPTLAFIFDAYRYEAGRGAGSSMEEPRNSHRADDIEQLGNSASSPDQAQDDVGSAFRTFGAASHLRRGLTERDPSPTRTQHRSVASASTVMSFDGGPALRPSDLFTRSDTLDSLVSWATETDTRRRTGARGSVSSESRYAIWAPPTPTKDFDPGRPGPMRRPSAPVGQVAASHKAHDIERFSGSTERQRQVAARDAAHLEQDLAASRQLFRTFFTPPQELVDAAAQQARLYGRSVTVEEQPLPTRRISPERIRRKSVKGLEISAPTIPGQLHNAPGSIAFTTSPVEQVALSANDIFATAPPSAMHVQGFGRGQETEPRVHTTSRPYEVRDGPQAFPAVCTSAEIDASPTVSSPQTFSSAISSPVVPYFENPQDGSNAGHRISSGVSSTKKLRKPVHRTRSSPSLGRQQDNSSSASLASSGRIAPPVPPHDHMIRSLSSSLLKGKGKNQAASVASSKDSSERRVDYSVGISSKDFEEETVQIGKSEFEIVKPLAALLSQSEDGAGAGTEDDDHASIAPSHLAASSSAVDLTTPRRALPSSYPHTPSTAFGLSTVSLSHFSPPTPASVEDGGRGALDDYRKKEAQWVAALGSMTPEQVRKSKKMRALVQAGIPSSVRGKVWAFLAETHAIKHSGLFETMAGTHDDQTLLSADVERDISATLDQPQFAQGSVGRSDVFHVLQALSHLRPDLGYYSGLGSVAGLLLTQMPAEDAFWTLVSLVQAHGLRQYFPSAAKEHRLEILAFESLLEAMEPKLTRRLRELAVAPADYLPLWHSTLARFRVALALLDLSHLEDRTAFPSRDAVLNHLLAPPSTAFTPSLLIPAIAATKISDDKLKKAWAKAAKALQV